MRRPEESDVQGILNHPQFGKLAQFVRAETNQQKDDLARSIIAEFEQGGQVRFDLSTGLSYRHKPPGADSLSLYVEYLANQATPEYIQAVRDVEQHPAFSPMAAGKFFRAPTAEARAGLARSLAADYLAGAHVQAEEDPLLGEVLVSQRPAGAGTLDEFVQHHGRRSARKGPPQAKAVQVSSAPQTLTVSSLAMPGPALTDAETLEPCNITWAAAQGRYETSAPLQKLPGGVQFPDDFPEPIHYDAQLKRLTYRGFMTMMSYRYLRKLSNDLSYVAALDEINVKSSTVPASDASRIGRFWRWLFGAVVLAGAAAALLLARHHHWK